MFEHVRNDSVRLVLTKLPSIAGWRTLMGIVPRSFCSRVREAKHMVLEPLSRQVSSESCGYFARTGELHVRASYIVVVVHSYLVDDLCFLNAPLRLC